LSPHEKNTGGECEAWVGPIQRDCVKVFGSLVKFVFSKAEFGLCYTGQVLNYR
jgi:hypothetical protein